MLDLWQNDAAQAARPGAQEGRDLPATFGETFQDAWSNGQLATSGIKQTNARNQAVSEYIDQIKQAGGEKDFDAEYGRQVAALQDIGGEPDAFDVASKVVSGMRANGNPIVPRTSQDIDRRAVEISQGAIAAHAQMGQREQTMGSWFGNLAGATASSLTDPYNIPMMAIPLEGAGILGTAARVGAGMVATQTANEAVNAGFNEQVQPGYSASGQAATNVLEAGAGGLALGAGGALLGKVAGRFIGTAERDASNLRQSEANIAETNVLPGVEGEAAHPAALGKAIDDVLRENPVEVSQQVGALEPRVGERSMFHGTGSDLSDGVKTNLSGENVIYGNGFYTTSNPDIAAGYARSRSKLTGEGLVHEFAVSPDTKLFDLEQPIGKSQNLMGALANLPPKEIVAVHKAALEQMGTDIDRLTAAKMPDRLDDIANSGISSKQVADILRKVGGRDSSDELLAAIPHDEYDGLRHIGGGNTGNAPHEVNIFWKQDKLSPVASRELAPRSAPEPTVHQPAEIAESLAQPEVHDAMRADIERAIDESAKAGKALQIPVGIDENGEAIMGSATRALTEVDHYNALADALGQCALPMAQQAAE